MPAGQRGGLEVADEGLELFVAAQRAAGAAAARGLRHGGWAAGRRARGGRVLPAQAARTIRLASGEKAEQERRMRPFSTTFAPIFGGNPGFLRG